MKNSVLIKPASEKDIADIIFFINKLAEKIIEFHDGHISTYLGNYDYYKSEKQRLGLLKS